MSEKRSHIHGKGYGDSHMWISGETGWTRTTPYVCSACGAAFGHHYPSVPNIFQAMRLANVPEFCPASAHSAPSKSIQE
jgi:hypothetical protein